MLWHERSKELEIIDLGKDHYSEEEYLACLDKLGQVGEYLGGDRATFKALGKLSFSPRSILDVGCGGGAFTQKMGLMYREAAVVGIDISREAIGYAEEKNKQRNVFFEYRNLAAMASKSYDVVTATLVCHHLADAELIDFLRECLRVAKYKVVVNDLHRHPMAWMAFACIAPMLFRNRLITHDGCLSIKRSFKKNDWERYIKELQVQACLSWYWPFRWILTLDAP